MAVNVESPAEVREIAPAKIHLTVSRGCTSAYCGELAFSEVHRKWRYIPIAGDREYDSTLLRSLADLLDRKNGKASPVPQDATHDY